MRLSREPGDGPPPDKLVGALSAGLAVLRYLNETGARVGVSRVARDLGLNPSTCFNLLRTLVYEGLVTFDPGAKTYALGLGVVELAKGALDQASFARFMRPQLEAVSRSHGVTTVLWQRAGADRVVLVDHCEAESAVRLHMQIGQRLPMYVAALGRCMAAHSGLGKAALRQAFKALRWEDPPSFDAYFRSVEEARARGYGVDTGNYVRGVTSVSTVVRDGDGVAIMALTATGFGAQLTPSRVQALGKDLRDRAAAVERALSGGVSADAGAVQARARGGR